MLTGNVRLFITGAVAAVMFSVNLTTPLGFADWIVYLLLILLSYQWFLKQGIFLMAIVRSLLVTMDFFSLPTVC